MLARFSNSTRGAAVILLAALFLSSPHASAQDDATLHDHFRFDGAKSIMAEGHFGIVDGRLTTGVNYGNIGELDGIHAPPFVSSDFRMECWLWDLKVPVVKYSWWPYRVEEKGLVGGLELTWTGTALYANRVMLWSLTLDNTTEQPQEVPLRIAVNGSLDRAETWEFARPASATGTVALVAPDRTGRMTLRQSELAVVVETREVGIAWSPDDRSARGTIAIAPGESKTLQFAVAVDVETAANAAVDAMLANLGEAESRARTFHTERVRELFTKLPRFESDNAELNALYNRSLVHLLTNRWDVPEFTLKPYYATGSVRGGCLCNYLWNFGENWEIFPLYDPDAAKTHIKQFLKTDLFNHFAFLPIAGDAFGPWYPVNQEKIIGLVYYYVLNTGDVAFLDEEVDGKTILEHMYLQAMYRDDVAQPQQLIDYGPSNSHLELRRGIPYNHVMPDLNGRRYANYLRVAELFDLVGTPKPELGERAVLLKSLLTKELWDEQKQWLAFRNDAGEESLRYTVQMFKLIGSGVLDPNQERGILSHLNETEFLSEFGLHSMSKRDIAYDQIDIDNGGGGICTCFTPQIIERMYRAGYATQADDLLRRILWWGQHMPYWGDSLEANRVAYRRDTPLQSTIDGATVAQCIIFGMFGIQANADGSVTVNPHRPAYVNEMILTGLRLGGRLLNISVTKENNRVIVDGVVKELRPSERFDIAR